MMVFIMLCAASAGSQLGTTATKFVDAGRIRVLFGITILSGSGSMALKQVAESNADLAYLSTAASFLLLGVAGAICLVIAGMLIRAKLKKPEVFESEGAKGTKV